MSEGVISALRFIVALVFVIVIYYVLVGIQYVVDTYRTRYQRKKKTKIMIDNCSLLCDPDKLPTVQSPKPKLTRIRRPTRMARPTPVTFRFGGIHSNSENDSKKKDQQPPSQREISTNDLHKRSNENIPLHTASLTAFSVPQALSREDVRVEPSVTLADNKSAELVKPPLGEAQTSAKFKGGETSSSTQNSDVRVDAPSTSSPTTDLSQNSSSGTDNPRAGAGADPSGHALFRDSFANAGDSDELTSRSNCCSSDSECETSYDGDSTGLTCDCSDSHADLSEDVVDTDAECFYFARLAAGAEEAALVGNSQPSTVPSAKETAASTQGILQMFPNSTMTAGCTECQMRRLHPVVFRWHNPTPRTVFVTGSFLNWQGKIAMRKDERGFGVEVRLPAGHHEFKFIVDRRWALDEKRLPTIVTKEGHVHHVVHV